MNRIKTCKNKCIFCFISQLPPDMRSSLYIRDDDYTESYTHGNFITLTNTSIKDIEKIIKFEVEPLNVSVHSFNRDIRNLLFANKRNYKGVENLFLLDRSKISTNIQIVLCPGINDGKDLENTLDILIKQFKNILSIGIVPVGITKYNRTSCVKTYEKPSSQKLIESIEKYRKLNKENNNTRKIYLSDEFYLLAEKKFPDFKEYGGFPQIQNGIGKTVDFIQEIKQYLPHYTHKSQEILTNNILIVTSEHGRRIFSEIIELISKNKTQLRTSDDLNI